MSVRVFSSIDELPGEDSVLLSYKNQQKFFNAVEWFNCLVDQEIAGNSKIRIYRIVNDNAENDRCYLFCMYDEAARTLSGLGNFYSMEFSPVFSGDEATRPALLDELFDFIANETPRWRKLNFKLIYSETVLAGYLAKNIRRFGFYPDKYFMFENYFETLEGNDFPAYYASRPSRVKNTIKRKEKKLAKTHEYTMRIFREYDEGAIRDYTDVYENSWKESEQFPGFIPALCRLGSSLGVLRMGVLYIEGKAVAAQLWLLSGRKAIIYKLAYNEDFKDFSVGSILTREVLQHVMENDDINEIDYGVGSENYKREWMDQTRTLVGFELFNRRTFSGAILTAKALAAQGLKKFRRAG